jgi:hypothetical protein
MSLAEHFSATMPEADAKFTAGCARHGVQPVFYSHPLLGRDGEKIQVGTALLGNPNATSTMLILSGEHGIEGYAGAGIQTALLERGGFDLGDDCSLLFVHQINPWGCAWDRRENENNVDLFRNFTYSSRPSKTDPLYPEIDAALNLRAWSGAERERADERRRSLVQRHGGDRVIAAMRRGQSEFPKGMTYHGAGPTWSKLIIDQILRENLPNCRRLFVLNLHTGFGAYGEGIIVCYEDPASRNYQMLERLYGRIYAPGNDASIPTHSDPLPWSFAAEVLPGLDVCMIAIEYGTENQGRSMPILQGNLYFHMHGDPTSPEALQIAKDYRRLFYAEEDGWKQAVAERGLDVFDTALAELKRLAQADPVPEGV